MQFSLRWLFGVTLAIAIASWFAFQVVLPNWHEPSFLAGYGYGGHPTNSVSYELGRLTLATVYASAAGAVISGVGIAAVSLARAKA